MPSLKRSAAGVIGKRARRHFIIGARHFDGSSGRQIIEREIDGTATVVARTLSGISDENPSFGRGGIPEDFRDVPGAVGIVDQQAVAEWSEVPLDAQQSFGRRALKKSASLGVDGRCKKIVRRSVTNVEVNRRIERSEFDQDRI